MGKHRAWLAVIPLQTGAQAPSSISTFWTASVQKLKSSAAERGWSWDGVREEETGIFPGKICEQREDTQHTGHGQIARGAKEENIPWPSSYQQSSAPRPASWIRFSRRETQQIVIVLITITIKRGRGRWTSCPGWAKSMIFHTKWAAMGRWKVLLMFSPCRWNKMHTGQEKDAAGFLFKLWHIALSKNKIKACVGMVKCKRYSTRQTVWDAGNSSLHTPLMYTMIPLKAIT